MNNESNRRYARHTPVKTELDEFNDAVATLALRAAAIAERAGISFSFPLGGEWRQRDAFSAFAAVMTLGSIEVRPGRGGAYEVRHRVVGKQEPLLVDAALNVRKIFVESSERFFNELKSAAAAKNKSIREATEEARRVIDNLDQDDPE